MLFLPWYLLILCVFLTGAACARELVLEHTGQPSVTFAQAAQKFAEFLNEESRGALTMNVMGAAALGNNREGIEQLQQGVTDFWIISTGLLAPFTTARVYQEGDLFDGGIAVKDGRIVSVSEDAFLPEALDTIDAKGMAVLPGVIDTHRPCPRPRTQGTRDVCVGNEGRRRRDQLFRTSYLLAPLFPRDTES